MKRLMIASKVELVVLIVVALSMTGVLSSRAAEPPQDREVLDAVEEKLLVDPAVPFNEIDVGVKDGVVTLAGTVSSLLAKERATRLAQLISGVRSVVSEIVVEPVEEVSDDRLERDVRVALEIDPAAGGEGVTVSVKDGKVTLRGKVDSWQRKDLTALVAMGVRGVRALDDRVEVESVEDKPDEQIKKEIEAALRWNALVDGALIEVKVEDGEVRLDGTVGSAAEKDEAVSTAWQAGVTSVDAEGLEVERWARDPDLREGKYAKRSDRELEMAVADALQLDPRVDRKQVKVAVDNGVVTLGGEVENLKAKRSAAADARNTVGVRWVKNRVKVRPQEEKESARLAGDVQAALGRDPWVWKRDIRAKTVSGTVYLEGMVETYFEKARADEVASRVAGVVEVENNLEVDDEHRPLVCNPYVDPWTLEDLCWYDFEPTGVLKSDDAIQIDIDRNLAFNPFVDDTAVTVTVEDGVATLEGEVETLLGRSLALQSAVEGGAIWVVNELTIDTSS